MPPRHHPLLGPAHASLMPLRPYADPQLMGETHLMGAALESRVAENRGSHRTETGLDG
jgi:hypothetical protein